MEEKIYAKPKTDIGIEDCIFYHTIELPGYGVVEGKWDLRNGVDEYLGHVSFKGKKVLEVGTASGFLAFEMEKRGADVVSFDLSPDYDWDIVPFAQYDYKRVQLSRRENIRKLNNSYWFSHGLLKSNTRAVYGNVYNIPDQIGKTDIVTFGSILLHVRDPFLALQSGSRFAKETVVVTEVFRGNTAHLKMPVMEFLPNPELVEPKAAWWNITPDIIIKMFGVLGFEKCSVSFHQQKFIERYSKMFTVVGHRTR